MNLTILFLCGIFSIFFLGFNSYKSISTCIISEPDDKMMDGIYHELLGAKTKIFSRFSDTFLPFFDHLTLSRSKIQLQKVSTPHILLNQKTKVWLLFKDQDTTISKASAVNGEFYSFDTPPEKWSKSSIDKEEGFMRVECSQSIFYPVLYPFQVPWFEKGSNLSSVISRGGTTLFFVLNVTIAYLIWSKEIGVDAVAFAYDWVVGRREVWRVFTASLSHFDLLHIGFNMMAWWSMGVVEEMEGSFFFFSLTLSLIPLTISACLLMTKGLVTRLQAQDPVNEGAIEVMRSRPAVGFSCVLFGWMVALCLKMPSYCPIFFLPSLCFPTFPLPLIHIPFNFAPFVLLLITQFIMPRASMLGHLSGIVWGFPLAWGWINLLTPPSLFPSLLCVIILLESMFPSSSSTTNNSNHQPDRSFKVFAPSDRDPSPSLTNHPPSFFYLILSLLLSSSFIFIYFIPSIATPPSFSLLLRSIMSTSSIFLLYSSKRGGLRPHILLSSFLSFSTIAIYDLFSLGNSPRHILLPPFFLCAHFSHNC